VYNKDKSLKLFEKRKDILSKKNILPQELLDLAEFTFKNQVKSFDLLDTVLPEEMELTPIDQVMSGKPLLARDSFPFDLEESLKLFDILLKHLKGSPGNLKSPAGIIESEIKKNPDLPKESFEKYLQADDHFFRTFGEKTPESPRILNFLIQTAITPSIVKSAEKIYLVLPQNHTWTFGHCPVCGSLPYISSLQSKEGARHLHCSFCHTDFRFLRMVCPFCQEKKEACFEYFTVKEHPGFRVDVCKTCNMYIKTIDFRQMDKKILPIMDDLESLTLDILARNEGFNRPTLSAWGF
jgi:FdhE protein